MAGPFYKVNNVKVTLLSLYVNIFFPGRDPEGNRRAIGLIYSYFSGI